jgi:formyltetrahydrofolate deformylase
MSADAHPVVLTLSCPDRVGIVAAVTRELAEHGALIAEAQHFREPIASRSILRIVFEAGEWKAPDLDTLRRDFSAVAARLAMSWAINDSAERPWVLAAVSKQGHCLSSLLHRRAAGPLPIDIVGVVSNHKAQRRLVDWRELPFHCPPIEPEREAEQEAQLLALFADLKADLLLPARYMQVLSDSACKALTGRVINIHHSFFAEVQEGQPLRPGLMHAA